MEADPPFAGAEVSTEDSVERRTRLETASRKKLAIPLSCPSTSEPSTEILMNSQHHGPAVKWGLILTFL